MSKLSVSSYHKGGKIRIDGVEVQVHVRRMTMQEFIDYERAYFDYAQGDRGVKVDVDTSGMSPEDAFLAIQKAEANQHLTMTADQREAERDRTIARATELLAWLEAEVKANIQIPPGEIDIDGEPVLTGADVCRVFGARQLLMMQFANVIWAQNRLPEGVLKNLPSPSDFPDGSEERETAAAGQTPGPTAASAGEPDSAATADATQALRLVVTSSGETTE